MKTYEKPDVEYVSLVSEENIASSENLEGDTDLVSSIF